jgi:cyclase
MNKLASLTLLVACTGMLYTGLSYGEAEEEALTVSTAQIKGSLYLLQGRGGNVMASIGKDGILLIDDDYAQFATAYRAALSALDQSGRQPRFVLNTHWHGDHTGGNEFWAERGAVVVAHQNVRQRMGSRQEMKALGRVVEASPVIALPVVTYGDSLALHFNGDDIEVQHYPRGHTDGDSVVYFSAANVLHMGDHFFKDRFPFVDIGSGGNVFGYMANIEGILAKVDGDTVIVPGHGNLADRGDLQRFLEMLKSTTAEIKSGREQGLDADALLARGLDKQWSSWGGGFINEETWIRTILGSL